MTRNIIRNFLKKKLSWLFLFLFGVFIYLAYYQLWHHSKQVPGNIYTKDKVLQAHRAEIWTVKFSPNGNWFASGSVDSTVKLWNKENAKIILNIKQPAGITDLDISPDGNYVATVSYDSKPRIWKLPEAELVREFIGHTGTVWSVNFSPDGKTMASCGEDAIIRLWDVAQGKMAGALKGHTRNVWDVKFSPDGKTLASGGFDKTIRIWNVQDGKLLHTLTNHTEAIVAISFSADGRKMVSTSDDKTIRLWDTHNWSNLHILKVPEHNQAADFSPDGKRLITGGRDKTALGELLQNFLGDSKYNKGVSMRLWDVETGQLLQTFSEHYNDVNDVSFSPDGKWIVSAGSDKNVMLWRLNP